jgi:hypothetical protein
MPVALRRICTRRSLDGQTQHGLADRDQPNHVLDNNNEMKAVAIAPIDGDQKLSELLLNLANFNKIVNESSWKRWGRQQLEAIPRLEIPATF